MDFEKRAEAALTTLLVDVAEIKVDLRNHMKRTELNEERIHNLEKWLLGLLSAILVSVLVKVYF